MRHYVKSGVRVLRGMPKPSAEQSVFVNVPFDATYRPRFEAILFTITICGYVPRCALEVQDSSEVRIDKIYNLIKGCRYGIHDISRTELDAGTNLPRFNMPFELGVFLGAKRFGDQVQRRKCALILDRSPYRFKKFLSDIAGQDIKDHRDQLVLIIRRVRDWLQHARASPQLLGGEAINRSFRQFRRALPKSCAHAKLSYQDLSYPDLTNFINRWLIKTADATELSTS